MGDMITIVVPCPVARRKKMYQSINRTMHMNSNQDVVEVGPY